MVSNNYVFPIISEYDQTLPLCVFTAGWETLYATENINTFRPNGIPHHQFLFTAEGSAECIFEKNKVIAGPGSFMYHSPYTPQIYQTISNPWICYWITFTSNSPALFTLKNGVHNIGDVSVFIDIISQIITLKNNFLYGEKSSALLYQLILKLKRIMSETTPNDNYQTLKPIVTYLNENFRNEITLETLSDILGITPGYFCKIFKDAYHIRPFEYIQKLRIQHSKTLLVSFPDMPISEISMQSGYQSTSYFIKQFKLLEGVTPLEFRKQYITF